MALPGWGLALLVVYPLLQIPAVVLIARYCEVDASDLPTPPMRAFWSDGTSETEDTASNDAATAEGDPAFAPTVVRCDRCGETNDPSFGRCRNCVARLP
jgi:hypothetical protein